MVAGSARSASTLTAAAAPTGTLTPTITLTPTATFTPAESSASIVISEIQWTGAVAGGAHTGRGVVEVHAAQPWRLVVTKDHDPQRAGGKTLPSANLTCTSTGGDPKCSVVEPIEFSTEGAVVAGSDEGTPDEGSL